MSKVGAAVRWNEEGGFGFIKQSDGGADLFCHRSALLGRDRDACLIEGETVFYDAAVDERSGRDRATGVSGPAVSAGGGGGAGYHRTPLGDGCAYTPHDVQDMLEDRQAARRARDFQKADRISDDLRANGVIIDDQTMVWESRSGERGTFGYGPDGRQSHAAMNTAGGTSKPASAPAGCRATDEPWPGKMATPDARGSYSIRFGMRTQDVKQPNRTLGSVAGRGGAPQLGRGLKVGGGFCNGCGAGGLLLRPSPMRVGLGPGVYCEGCITAGEAGVGPGGRGKGLGRWRNQQTGGHMEAMMGRYQSYMREFARGRDRDRR